MMQVHGRRYDTGEPVRITIHGDRITAVEAVTPRGDVRNWPWVGPGLFDLQINGHGGVWFSREDLNAEHVRAVLEPHFQFGVTRMLPTLVTASHRALLGGFNAIRQACEQHPWINRMVPGCHLEGPYISPLDGPRGAHPLEHVRAASWSEFEQYQAASGNRIRLVTLAAEAEGAVDFIRKAVANNVVIAIGHTGASSEQIAAAVDAGARLSTHLGNGAHGQIRRHPNYIWDQLGDTRLMASLITDGIHLPPAVIRSMIRAKSPSRIVITCDAAGLAGCPPGMYKLDKGDVEILEDGRIVIAGQHQLLAGSSLSTDVCVTHAVDAGGITLGQAFDMAGKNPCRLLGLEVARLRRGSLADLVVFHYAGRGQRMDCVATIAAGELRYGSLEEAAAA